MMAAAVTVEDICTECWGPLLQQGEEGNGVVFTPSDHVVHKTCVHELSGENGSEQYNTRKRKRPLELYCPKRQCLESYATYPNENEPAVPVDLYFVNPDASSVLQNLVTELRAEKKNEGERLQEEIKKLEKENRQLAHDNEVQKALSEQFRIENNKLKKRMITAEVKLTLLTNGDLLEEKFGELKWSELTSTFQEELMGKLQVSGAFMNFGEILPINSKGLLRLIKADKIDVKLLEKIIKDYFEEKKQSNGNLSWDDIDSSLRVFLASKLRKTSKVESLELAQVPLSSNILVHLIKVETENNPYFLGDIVNEYVEDTVIESLTEVDDLFMVALVASINSEVIGCLEINFSKPQALERLVEVGMLRKNESEFEAPYEFSHDSVRYCIVGKIMCEVMGQVDVSRINALHLCHGGYTDALGVYFADYMSEVSFMVMLEDFNFDMNSYNKTLAYLFTILCVMKLPSLEPVITVLQYYLRNVNILDIVLSRKIPLCKGQTFTLLHAAAIRGDMERMKCLLYTFGLSKELTNPRFRNLIVACVENTKECGDYQIQERGEIIKELVKLNHDLLNCDASSTSLNVHDGLIKLMTLLRLDSSLPLVPTSKVDK